MVLVGLNKNIVATELRDRVSLLIDDMKSAIQRVVNDNNEDFNKTADDILENLVGDILDNSLGERLSELFSAYDLVGDTSRDRYILNREIFSFGTGRPRSLLSKARAFFTTLNCWGAPFLFHVTCAIPMRPTPILKHIPNSRLSWVGLP